MKKLQTKPFKLLVILTLIAAFQLKISPTQAQSSDVRGKVSSKEDGSGLPGVSVIVKGTTNGTTTDQNGDFAIRVQSSSDVLVFSFIGYKSTEVTVGSQTTFDVALDPDIETLSEVVVVGYGETKKESLTSAITSVKGKEFVKSPQPNLSSSFAGRVPGVIANASTGEPGYDGARLLIRGQSTNGDNSPLIVIDGVASRLGGLERLDPNDIESVSVLKDASAAIYGAQAANGVILVTTKRGKTSSAPVFNFSYNQGFAKPTRLPKMADAATFANIQNEIAYYGSQAGGMNQIYSEEEIQKFRDGSDPIRYANTDWLKETMKSYALQDQQNLSVSGGGNEVQYFVSLGRRHQEGIYKNTNLRYEQWNIRSNIDINLTKNLKVGLDLAGRSEDRRYPTESAGSIFRAAIRTAPTMPAYYPGGLPSQGAESGLNPVVIGTRATGFDEQPRTVINTLMNFDYKVPFLSGLSLKGFYAHDRTFETRKLFRTPWTTYKIIGTTDPITYEEKLGGPATPELTQRQTNEILSTANFSINYEKQIGATFLKAFIAYEQNVRKGSWFEAFRRGFLTEEVPEIDMGGSLPEERNNYGNSWILTRRNYFGRVAADYKSRYLAEVQFRYDGSSIFQESNRWGFFPSASVGWRISEEPFFQVPAVDNLKLRASYGSLGNDRVGGYQYLNTYNIRMSNYVLDGQPVATYGISQLANEDITWETANKLDIGLETTLFKKLTIELDYFHEHRTGLLIPRTGTTPWVSGIVNEFDAANIIPLENIGEAKNRGIEAQVTYNYQINKLGLTLGGNFMYNKSEAVFMNDPVGMLSYQRTEGSPFGAQLLYQSLGVYNTQDELDQYPGVPGAGLGDLIYKDVNGDGEITANDRIRESLTNVPRITYGFTLAANYGNFDLSLLLQGQAQVAQYVLPESGSIGNFFSSWADNRWTPSNTEGSYPRVAVRTSSSVNGSYRNDFWFYNTAFLRIKNVELGYNVSPEIASKVKLKSARVYISAFNLATFSKVKDFDPEGQSESAQFYPQQQIFNIGANLKF